MSDSASIDVSVVIPAYQRLGFLPQTIDSVLDQEFDGTLELIVVISADDERELGSIPDIPDDPRVTAVRRPQRTSAATARNIGVMKAGGRGIAFTDADVLTLPGWLASLVAASDGDRRTVAGSVINGTPRSIVGTADYVAEFVDLHPSRPPQHAWHGALCNLYVPRAHWERFGPFPEDMTGGEDTALTTALRKEGLFVFEPRARIAHMNRTDLQAMLTHHYKLGQIAAELGRVSPDYRFQALVRYTLLAPVAALGRIASVYARALSWMKGERIRAVIGFPVVVAALLWWGAGLLARGLQLDLKR